MATKSREKKSDVVAEIERLLATLAEAPSPAHRARLDELAVRYPQWFADVFARLDLDDEADGGPSVTAPPAAAPAPGTRRASTSAPSAPPAPTGVTSRVWTTWLGEAPANAKPTPQLSPDVFATVAARVNAATTGVRAYGSRHTDTALAAPESLGVDGLNAGKGGKRGVPRFLPPGDVHRTPEAKAAGVRWVAGNATIDDIIRELDAPAELRALANIGSFTGQTIAGAVNVGTHGSGAGLGCIADAILAVDLLLADGTEVRIERHGGPTANPIAPRVLQDDDLFHAAVVGLGAMGVVRGYLIQTVPRYYLREWANLRAWAKIKDSVVAAVKAGTSLTPARAASIRHLELLLNPYLDGPDNVLVVERATTKDSSPTGKPGARGRIMRRDGVREVLANAPPAVVAVALAAAMKTQARGTKVRRDRWFSILSRNSGVEAHGFEIAFPATDEHFVKGIDTIRAAIGASKGVLNTFIAVRFVKASEHFAAMSYHTIAGEKHDVFAFVELARLKGTPDHARVVVDVEAALRKAGVPVRMHWGQYNWNDEKLPDGKRRFDAQWPEHATWRAARARLDPHGKFLNAYLTKAVA